MQNAVHAWCDATDWEPGHTVTQVKLGRAARTDAGVHAAGNVVSMKLITIIPGVKDLVARINEELPPEIRLWSIVSARRSQSTANGPHCHTAPRSKLI